MEGLHYHLFADDMQSQKHGRPADVPAIISALEDCATDVSAWCSAKLLELNAEKTEVLWFDTPANLRKIPSDNRSIRLGSTVVDPVNVVRDLGVFLDTELSMRDHVICVDCGQSVARSAATCLHLRFITARLL